MNKLTMFLFLLLVFVLSFLPVKDTDFGWHYRCGNEFLTKGTLCTSNTFSYYLPNYQSANPHLLYDILLAFVYNHGGFVAVSIVGAFVITVCAYLFSKLINQALWIKILAFVSVFYLSSSVFGLGLRSQTITYFFTLLLLNILNQKKQKLFLFIPLLFLFWVNFHIGFFVGLIVLFFYYIDNFFLLKDGRPIVKLHNFFPFLIFFFSFIATLINPFGINVYKEILNHAYAPLSNMIAEWTQPTFFHIFLIIILFLASFYLMIKNKSVSLYKILLLFFFMFLTLKANRNLPFFYTYVFILILNNRVMLNLFQHPFQNRSRSKFGMTIQRLNDNLLFPILIAFLLFFIIIVTPQTISFDTNWEAICNTTTVTPYPCIALKKYQQLSGNVFANYEWGGFLIWQKPNIKVFVDGRMSAWQAPDNTYPYQTYLEIIQTKNNWNEKLKKLKTDYLLIAQGTFLDLLLQKNPKKYGWEEKYRDQNSVVYYAL